MQITEDQFEIINDVSVVHKPSEIHVSTNRYKDPAQIGDLVIRDAGPSSRVISGEEVHRIKLVALSILRKQQAT